MPGVTVDTGYFEAPRWEVKDEADITPMRQPGERYSLLLQGEGYQRMQIAGCSPQHLRHLHEAIGATVGAPVDTELVELLRYVADCEGGCTCLHVTGMGRVLCWFCRAAALLRRYDACRCDGEADPSPCAYCKAKIAEQARAEAVQVGG